MYSFCSEEHARKTVIKVTTKRISMNTLFIVSSTSTALLQLKI